VASAHGEGKVSPRHIRNAVFLSDFENIEKLRQEWAMRRIMGFFVEQRGQILDLTEPTGGVVFHRKTPAYARSHGPLTPWQDSLETQKMMASLSYAQLLGEDADFKTFMGEMSFYNFIYVAKEMVSRGHPENVVKFLFLLSRIYKLRWDNGSATDYMGISRDWSQYAVLLDRVLEKISIDELTGGKVSYEIITDVESGKCALRVSSPDDIDFSLPFDISARGHLTIHIEKLRKHVQSCRDLSWFVASLRPGKKESGKMEETSPLVNDNRLADMISGLYNSVRETSPENYEKMFKAIQRYQESLWNKDAEYEMLGLDAVQKYALGLSIILRGVYYSTVEKNGLYWSMKTLEDLGVDNLTAELTAALVWLYPAYCQAVRGGEGDTGEFLSRTETVLEYWRERGIFREISRDRLTALLNFHVKAAGENLPVASSLGTEAMESVLSDAAERYSKESGRPDPGIISEVARSLGMGTYRIPDALASLYYSEAILRDRQKRGAATEPESASARLFNLGEMSPYILKHLGVRKMNSSGPFVVYVDGLLDEQSADKLAAAMQENEQLIAVWGSLRNKGQVPKLIGKFFRARHFKTKAVPDTLFGRGQLGQFCSQHPDALPVIFSSDGNEEVLSDAGKGFKVRFQIRELTASGLDVGQTVSLIKQVMEDPENARGHLNRMGVFEKDGFWTIGSGFVHFLESLYDRFMAGDEIRTAA